MLEMIFSAFLVGFLVAIPPGTVTVAAAQKSISYGFRSGIAFTFGSCISDILYIHEYIISFFIVAIGTSLPELAVDINALRLGHHQIAIGDIVGSCIVDSTLSIGIGFVVFNQDPSIITPQLAIPTVLYTLIASFFVFVAIAARKKVDKKAGIFFISLYLLSYVFLFSFWIRVH